MTGSLHLRKKPNHHGYSLVLVLWLLTLLSLITGITVNQTRTGTQVAGITTHRQKALAAAEAGLWLSIQEISSYNPSSLVQFNGQKTSRDFDGSHIHVYVQSINSKLNLNTADPQLFELLFESAGLSPSDSERLVAQLADWTDSDSETAQNLSETKIYRDKGLDYVPNNRSFTTVDELRLVADMEDPVFREIMPFLTVYGNARQLNIASADPELVSRILNVSNSEAEDIQSEVTENNNLNGLPAIQSSIRRAFTADVGNIFSLTAQGTHNQVSVRMEAIVEIQPNNRSEPYRILGWQAL